MLNNDPLTKEPATLPMTRQLTWVYCENKLLFIEETISAPLSHQSSAAVCQRGEMDIQV